MERLNTTEAAEYLGVHPQTLGNWRKNHTGPPYYTVGRSIRYAVTDLNNYILDQRVEPRTGRVCKK